MAYGLLPPLVFAALTVALIAFVLIANASRVWLVAGVLISGMVTLGFFTSKTAWQIFKPE